MTIPVVFQDKVGRLSNLPTLPQVAAHVIERVSLPETTVQSLATIISQDVSLSAKIVRLANSAFYGIPRTIANINDAIIILGFNTVYTLVLGITVFDIFKKNRGTLQFDRKLFWGHSILCAHLSKLMARKIRKMNADDAFCAGLLHDIGKIVMEQYFHDDLLKAIDYASLTGTAPFEAEKAVLGYTHTDVGEWLIANWNLPEALACSIVYHHSTHRFLDAPPMRNFHKNIGSLCICHIADYLTYDHHLDFLPQISHTPPSLNPKCFAFLGLTSSSVDECIAQVKQEWETMNLFYDVLDK